jgi:hypothetical protein
MKLATSAANMIASHVKLKWNNFGHAERTLVKAGSAT